MKVLVPQPDSGLVIRSNRDGRGNAVPLQIEVVSEAVGVLVHAIEPECNLIAQWLIEIRGKALVPERSALQTDFAKRRKTSLFRDTIDDASTAATTEYHGVRTLDRLDTLHIVKITKILHIVTNTVYIEIRGRGISADHRCVTVSFALRHRDTWNVANDVCHAHHQLVFDQLAAHNCD